MYISNTLYIFYIFTFQWNSETNKQHSKNSSIREIKTNTDIVRMANERCSCIALATAQQTTLEKRLRLTDSDKSRLVVPKLN